LGKSRADRIAAAAARLRELYARSGCLHISHDGRYGDEGSHRRKRWYELRLRAWDFSELTEMVRLLQVVGIEAGRPYVTSGQPVVPVYGEERVRRAIRDLGLERARKRHAGEPDEMPRAGPLSRDRKMSSVRQFEVGMRLYTRGPLTAEGLRANGGLLALMERRGLVEPVADGTRTIWRLTPAGRKATRCYRKAYDAWRRSRR
jgi:hypothetical protein